jgi:hypothetical protein
MKEESCQEEMEQALSGVKVRGPEEVPVEAEAEDKGEALVPVL